MSLRSFTIVVLGLLMVSPSWGLSNKTKKKLDEDYCNIREDFYQSNNRLYCAACAYEKMTGVSPSEKYMSLLGYTTAKYESQGSSMNESKTRITQGRSSQGGTAMALFQADVIRKMQAYGVCSNTSQYGKVNTPIRNLIFRSVTNYGAKAIPLVKDGKEQGKTTDSTGYSTPEEKEIVKHLGLSNADAGRYLFVDDRWETSSALERGRAFQERSGTTYASSGEEGAGLKACMGEIASNRRSSPYFTDESMNTELCEAMAHECELDLSICANPRAPSKGGVVVPPAQPIKAVPGAR